MKTAGNASGKFAKKERSPNGFDVFFALVEPFVFFVLSILFVVLGVATGDKFLFSVIASALMLASAKSLEWNMNSI